ncbi:MAG TPA: radical SAM family RiPP maturation amino acid epimerase [Longimicrobium sp.]|nr:radical SAM family RiPP maturation amino acid epimerase [Longimicrobium sp.]
MGDLSGVPPEYISQISNIKRLLERWTMDPKYRAAFAEDPAAAIAQLGLPLRPEEIIPLIDEEEGRRLTQAMREGGDEHYPLSTRRYRAFYREKRLHRRDIRKSCQSHDPRLAAWRSRQIQRCMGELGLRKADALVHAPASFELSKGCTVGCWFCGVAAPKFDHWFPYTDENAALWRGTLEVLRDVMGPAIKQGFLYWATDPLDNPDYEHFLADFREITGRCPQTTTAQGAKDIERTRNLLRLSHSLGSEIDRFSVLTLKILERIHEGFRPEEMIRVECVPQNRESSDKYRKANAGRARLKAMARGAEVMPEESSSTIACVSGFLFNMVERSVQMITPCNASNRWPLGYWVVARETFDSPEELREVLDRMIEEHAHPWLRLTDVPRLRPRLTREHDEGTFSIVSPWLRITFKGQGETGPLLERLAEGRHTVEELAVLREQETGIPLEQTFLLLEDLFRRGLFDEEPHTVVALGRELAAV